MHNFLEKIYLYCKGVDRSKLATKVVYCFLSLWH